jgi:glycosyltransferase involved in cell wall biosynthesis
VRALSLLLPGDPDTHTGGYLYDRRIAQELGTLGWRVQWRRLHDSFPFPDAAALAHAAQVLAALPDGAIALCDGLAFGAMPQLAAAAGTRLRLAALVHHPLALESGLDAACAAALEHAERAALAAASLVIATSARTAGVLQSRYRVPAARLAVVEPGTERTPPARGSGGSETVLLCVGTLTPRKGHDLLIDALAQVHPARWRLHCVGSLNRAPGWADALRARIDAAGLGDRVRLLGEVDAPALARCYEQADAFVLPTRLEGYGMALAEALARGLPVITSAGGAAADTVGDAALLVPGEDVGALAQALQRIITQPALRRELSAAALRRAHALPSWRQSAQRMDRALRRLDSV